MWITYLHVYVRNTDQFAAESKISVVGRAETFGGIFDMLFEMFKILSVYVLSASAMESTT